MTNKPTSSDIFDINRKTGALILGKNRLDDYATKYLARYCKKALETPMPLPVDEILQKANLTVKEVSLSRNLDIFGCCLLLDGEVEIYDHEQGTSKNVSFPAGTVLIDPDSEAMYGEGAKRNTLIHEALHWEKDKTYFGFDITHITEDDKQGEYYQLVKEQEILENQGKQRLSYE